MILEGNQRGGAKNLALHLLKEENDYVEVHELRGFVSDRLIPAFNEAYAVSRGTRAKKFLFSLSLNPPSEAEVSTPAFMDAIERAEAKLRLDGQPRAIVFHHKEGRRHCHVVWSRIDAVKMKAIHMNHTHLKLKDLSRELYHEYGWKMPPGFIRGQDRGNNFTLAEWQRAKRLGVDPNAIRNTIKDCWAASTNKTEFENLLASNGLSLAKGDRPYLVVDQYCQVHAIPRALKQPVKAVSQRLGDPEKIAELQNVKAAIAHGMHGKLTTQHASKDAAIHKRLDEIGVLKLTLNAQHRRELEMLTSKHTQRHILENAERQARFSKGWRGFFDRFNGRRRLIEKQNEQEFKSACSRDAEEKDALLLKHVSQMRNVVQRKKRLEHYRSATAEAVRSDLQQYAEIERGLKDHFIVEARPRGARPSRER